MVGGKGVAELLQSRGGLPGLSLGEGLARERGAPDIVATDGSPWASKGGLTHGGPPKIAMVG
ncbi:hypothetical protein TIFTF001_034397 [Ficus carica]|uniref:Uncharacterized protein n=1 Tax=Ficus carica TaxID=3494 RepID=A0AA88J8S1_FICCA|nr:hypothetical protein TIFTF001_034397 [Ficus carica]